MKSLFTFVLLTALVAFGGAFIGKWKIPGLEDLPTAESVKRMTKSAEAPVEDIFPDQIRAQERPPSYFTPVKDSAAKSRNEQLLERGKEIGGE
jgi:hypothetical protein